MILLYPLLVLAVAVHPCTDGRGELVARNAPKAKMPKLIRRIAPLYTDQARQAAVPPSKLLLSMTVPVTGPSCDIEVVSPIGFGLDESAIDAVRQWEFKPAEQDGKPVAMIVTVEVAFMPTDRSIISQKEENRTQYNKALRDFDHPKSRDSALETIQKLSKSKYPAADAFLAYELYSGRDIPADPKVAFDLATRAAKQGNAYAKFTLSLILLEGKIVPKDEKQALQHMREAASGDVTRAQLWLAEHAEDQKTAQSYYRLCAAKLVQCQKGLETTSESYPGKTPQ
jgi:TonB family protein